MNSEIATFAAGCFWGVEEAFRTTAGVLGTAAGYMGGSVTNPTYRDVCTGNTGHAEVVQVQFDPDEVKFEALLGVFWAIHDPTQLNRQGPDIGTQYRSAIFYHTEPQREIAESSKVKLGKSCRYARPIATAIVPAGDFWPAEEYHQQYLQKRGLAACHI